MSGSPHLVTPHPEPRPQVVAIGWLGLLLPFALVLGLAIWLHDDSASQLALISLLLLFAIAVMVLRKRAEHERLS